MKKQLSLSLILLTLTACSGGIASNNVSLGVGLGTNIGRHVGLGTSINIPLGGIEKTETAPTNEVKLTHQQVLTYFDAQGNASEHPVKGGIQRRLLSKASADSYVVQDFYETGEKRSDPMTLNKKDVFTFRAHPENGSYTIYAINGVIMQQQNFKNNRLVHP